MTLKRRIIPFLKAFENKCRNDSSGYVDSEIEIDAEIDFADITLNSPILKQFEPLVR
jgi:hypothetical protein